MFLLRKKKNNTIMPSYLEAWSLTIYATGVTYLNASGYNTERSRSHLEVKNQNSFKKEGINHQI